jgi:excisionase family DNA binding protein
MPTGTKSPTLDQLAEEMRAMSGLLTEILKIVTSRLGGPVDTSDFDAVDVKPLEDVALSVAEASERLGVGAEQTRRLLRAGIVGGVQLGGRRGWLVSKASVERLRHERSLAAAASRPGARNRVTALAQAQPRSKKPTSDKVLV